MNFVHKWLDIEGKTKTCWCAVCGMLKMGPLSEPGAYNYFCYLIPKIHKDSDGTIISQNSNSPPYKYLEQKLDPSCIEYFEQTNES